MKGYLLLFVVVLGLKEVAANNAGKRCSVPAVCTRPMATYLSTEWIQLPEQSPTCEANSGLQCAKGETGPVGQKGENGTKGEIGPVGPKGENGTKGEIGLVGPKGNNGTKGDIGPVGEKGTKGEIGNQGENGTKGDIGDPGEDGTKGLSGDKGDAGPPGQCDSENDGASKAMLHLFCPIKIDGKCFLPISGIPYDFAGAAALCEKYGGQLANIYNQSHMNDIMIYIRSHFMPYLYAPAGDWGIYLALGLRFNFTTYTLSFRNGTVIDLNSLEWASGNLPLTLPQYGHYTAMALVVYKNPSDTRQYLSNVSPTMLVNVLCEIE